MSKNKCKFGMLAEIVIDLEAFDEIVIKEDLPLLQSDQARENVFYFYQIAEDIRQGVIDQGSRAQIDLEGKFLISSIS